MKCTGPQLPQELKDAIIDYLYDDPQTLAICTTVSHSWLHRARSHLFHSVALPLSKVMDPPTTQLNSFTTVLQSPSRIGSHISTLTINAQSWVPLDTLPPLLACLPSLQELIILDTELGVMKHIPPASRRVLSLKQLHLYHSTLSSPTFHTLLSLFDTIYTLCLEGVKLDDEYDLRARSPDMKQFIPAIQSINVPGGYIESAVICQLLHPYIQELKFCFLEFPRRLDDWSDYFDMVNDAFRVIGGHITSLRLDTSCVYMDTSSEFQWLAFYLPLLSHCPLLRHFHLVIQCDFIYEDDERSDSDLQWDTAVRSFAVIKQMCPSIRNVVIQIMYPSPLPIPFNARKFKSMVEELDWDGLQEAWAAFNRAVDLRVIVRVEDIRRMVWEEVIEEKFPDLLTTGVLKISDTSCGWEPCK